MRLTLVVLATIVSACSTPAPDGAAMDAAANDKICKRTEATGSNVPQRACRTQAEWAAIDKQGQADVDAFERARDEVAPTGQ